MARKSVSRWESIQEESQKGAAIYAGVDVHKSSYAVTLLSANGVSHTYTTSADNEGLIKQFQDHGISIKRLANEPLSPNYDYSAGVSHA